MAEAVYVLCALTSLACAILLLRGYLRSRTRLLLWSALCFFFLTANNVLLFLDRVVFPDLDYMLGVHFVIWRSLSAIIGLLLLVFGLIWDSE